MHKKAPAHAANMRGRNAQNLNILIIAPGLCNQRPEYGTYLSKASREQDPKREFQSRLWKYGDFHTMIPYLRYPRGTEEADHATGTQSACPFYLSPPLKGCRGSRTPKERPGVPPTGPARQLRGSTPKALVFIRSSPWPPPPAPTSHGNRF